MSNRRSKLTQWSSGGRRWSLVLRCVLLIGAWQGPPPSIHCHGTLANSPAGMGCWLAHHLQSHHASVAPFANVVFDWHVHFDPPGPAGDNPDHPGEPHQDRMPPADSAQGLLVSLTRNAGDSVNFPAPTLELQPSGVTIAASETSRSSGHFFDTFAPTLPLPMRFCVCRC